MSNESIYRSIAFGSIVGSDGFDDVRFAPASDIVGIKSIWLRASSEVIAIQTTYLLANGNEYRADKHGGDAGEVSTITFEEGETLIGIEGRRGDHIDALTFVTRKATGEVVQHGPYGGTGGYPFVLKGYIAGFYGRAVDSVYALGVYLSSPTTELFGGPAGEHGYSDSVLVLDPPAIAIKALTIWSGAYIDAIQTTYLRSDGTVFVDDKHGGGGGKPVTIAFADDETIVAIVGSSGTDWLKHIVFSLTVLTARSDGQRNTYGPYGGGGGATFIVNADVLGFFGRSGDYIDSIGCFTANPTLPETIVNGPDGYRYCVLESNAASNGCTIPVQAGSTDLSFRLKIIGVDNRGVGFIVTAPDGTTYSTQSEGSNSVWALAAQDTTLGLQTFYIANPMAGDWKATVSSPTREMEWTLIGTTNPANAAGAAKEAFAPLAPSEKQAIYRAAMPHGTPIPPELCFFCQAQIMAIMGLALATFVFWAGPVTATSAVVLYAQRLLGPTAVTLVTTINTLYGSWQKGMSIWNIARHICEMEGMCHASGSVERQDDGVTDRGLT